MSGLSEGVIKFKLEFQVGRPPVSDLVADLNRWRETLRRRGLIGQDPARYDGLGFGNLSRRMPGQNIMSFVITGTQTGHLKHLEPCHYAIVLSCRPKQNALIATGQVKPSSETLSHGVLYQASAKINAVMHLHSPTIFARADALNLPKTAADVEYGTPEMATEIDRLAKSIGFDQAALLIMAGHPDGILAYGPSMDETGALVLSVLKMAGERIG